MIKPYKEGSSEEIQGLVCHIPPVGYVHNKLTNQLEKRDIIKRSNKKSEQYWQRMGLPDWWKKKRADEIRRQEIDPDYIDPDCQSFRDTAWDRRINGCWFMNNGKPVYITGLHYFMLDWINGQVGSEINGDYPNFWDYHRKLFYFIDYCIEDENCVGGLLVTQRRAGKTLSSIPFVLDLPTRSKGKNGGIQSKTEDDAQYTVYGAVLHAFKYLPDFFVPLYDEASTLKSGINFVHTPKKGKMHNTDLLHDPLGGWISYKNSKEAAYDGKKLSRYVGDEIFKTEGVDVRKRHEIVTFCCRDFSGNFIGKMFYTSTVEEIKGDIDSYTKFWNESNQNERDNVTNRTKTNLFRFFVGADEVQNPDIYGYVDVERNREIIKSRRESLSNDLDLYYQYVRKEPLTIEEAFMISDNKGMFDSAKIMKRLEYLNFVIMDDKELFRKGDFMWERGERDTKVIWKDSSKGKFKLAFNPDSFEPNNVRRSGGLWIPNNRRRFVGGIDPFVKDTTIGKGSKGAGYIYHKHDSFEPDFSSSFVCQYLFRPPTADIFFEDMIMMCVFFGCPALIEDNSSIIKYFQRRGYGAFAITLPGRKEPGIPASAESKQEHAHAIEYWVHHYVDKCNYKELLDQLLKYDIQKTKEYDAVMAAGWALLADRELVYRQINDKAMEITDFFRPKRAV